jgi:hypothetical protein
VILIVGSVSIVLLWGFKQKLHQNHSRTELGRRSKTQSNKSEKEALWDEKTIVFISVMFFIVVQDKNS